MPLYHRALRQPPSSRPSGWTGFMAGVCSSHRIRGAKRTARRAALRLGFAIALLALPSCSELAATSDVMPPSAEPPFVSLAANYLQSALKDRAAYDDFQISGLRWIHAIRGWSWLACVHF